MHFHLGNKIRQFSISLSSFLPVSVDKNFIFRRRQRNKFYNHFFFMNRMENKYTLCLKKPDPKLFHKIDKNFITTAHILMIFGVDDRYSITLWVQNLIL